MIHDYLNKIKSGEIKDVAPKTARNYTSAFILFQDLLTSKCNDRNNKYIKYTKDISCINVSKNSKSI